MNEANWRSAHAKGHALALIALAVMAIVMLLFALPVLWLS